MKKILSLLILIVMVRCSSIDRQVFKARQIFDKYPNEAAKYCGDRFPVADSILSVTTDSSKGKTIDYTPVIIKLESTLDSAKTVLTKKQNVLTDFVHQVAFYQTQLANADKFVFELTHQINNVKATYKPCGVDTIRSAYTKIRVNTAKLTALTAQIVLDSQENKKLRQSLQVEKTTSLHRLYFLFGLALMFVIYVAFRVYEFFSGGSLISNIFR